LEPKIPRFDMCKLIITTAVYGFGDASGAGFGSTFGDQNSVHFQHGIWGSYAEAKSSNYRELATLVMSLEEGVASGRLRSSEVWIFTDNLTMESIFGRDVLLVLC
jgi:hypothetical protein